MAVLGLTKLEMLNQVMEAIGLPPATALPSAGADTTSIYYLGEETLDRVGRKVLIMGWPCNVIRNKTYTAALAGANYLITITNALRIHCTGPDRYAGKLSLLGDDVYIQETGSTDFLSGVAVNLDVLLNITLEDASPDLKERIADTAAQIFQRRQKGSRTQDGFLSEEALLSDVFTDRIQWPQNHPWNPRPIAVNSQAQNTRQQEQ